jgi:hypothetical protein
MAEKKPTKSPKKSRKSHLANAASAIDLQVVLVASKGVGSDLKLCARDVVFSQGDPADTVFCSPERLGA